MDIINEKQKGDAAYIAFFDRQKVGLYAPALYQAKQAAIAYFKPAKSKVHMVSVERAYEDGEEGQAPNAQFS